MFLEWLIMIRIDVFMVCDMFCRAFEVVKIYKPP